MKPGGRPEAHVPFSPRGARGGDGKAHGPDAYGKDGHFHDDNHSDKTKPNVHYRWGGRR
jgi:hypothetical protein